MSAPSNKPSKNGLIKLLFPPWRFGSNVKSAGSDLLDAATEACVRLEIVFAGFVVAGVVGEVVIAFRHPAYDSLWEIWGAVAGNFTVAIGVAVETLFLGLGHFIQGELSRRSSKMLTDANDRLADIEVRNAFLEESAAMATERAAKADLARVELEVKLQPRNLTEEQFRELQTLKGRVASVVITIPSDFEAARFAAQIGLALKHAGIEVVEGPQRIGRVWKNLYIVFPGEARDWTREILYRTFKRAGFSVGCGTRGQVPMDDLPADIPVLMVGEKGGLDSPFPPFMAGLATPKAPEQK